jgi:hypothetical protein
MPLNTLAKPNIINDARMCKAIDPPGVSGRITAPKASARAPETVPKATQYGVDLDEYLKKPAKKPAANAGTTPNKYENKAKASAPGTA